MKLLRTIRLDPSDTFIYPKGAGPGEWAVSGAFCFAHADIKSLEGKARAAFRGGFLGIDSFGWSTLVQIVEASEDDRRAACELLAQRLCERFGAPDLPAARQAAEEEIAFAASLCTQPKDMLIAVHRTCEGSQIRETFRALQRRGGTKPMRVFSFLEVEGEEDVPPDEISLVRMAQGESP